MSPTLLIFTGGVLVGFVTHAIWDEIKKEAERSTWRPVPARLEHGYCADCEAAVPITLGGQCATCLSSAVETARREPRALRLEEPKPIVFAWDEIEEELRGR